VGRLDTQVKIRGYRIELGEIETRLLEHEVVREAVVVAREESGGEKRLVAYYTVGARGSGREAEGVSAEQLRGYLKESLPDYMVPAALVELEQMPLTPNGKIDRKLLPKPEGVLRRQGLTYVSARNELENQVAEVWQRLLQLDRVGIHDNFFDLGGHSLLLARVHAELQQVLSRKLSIVDLFRHPTIADFAEFLSQGASDSVMTEAVAEKLEAGKARLRQQRARRGRAARGEAVS